MGLQQRMVRAAKLDVNLYEEVEADKAATGQAMLVVVLASIAGGIGAGLAGAGGERSWIGLLVLGTLSALLGWYVWAFLTYWIGTTIFKGPETSATIGELLRTTGFSSSPGVLRIFVFIPGIGPIIALAAAVWMLVAMVIAVRQALDFSTGRALGTCAVGWLIQMAVIGLFFALFGTPSA
jgi:hypothetical protein